MQLKKTFGRVVTVMGSTITLAALISALTAFPAIAATKTGGYLGCGSGYAVSSWTQSTGYTQHDFERRNGTYRGQWWNVGSTPAWRNYVAWDWTYADNWWLCGDTLPSAYVNCAVKPV